MKESAFKIWYDTYGSKMLVPHCIQMEKIDKKYETHKLYEKGSKIFGSFENELTDDNYINWFISKKNYACISRGEGKKCKVIKYKGLNEDSVLITGNEPFVYRDIHGQI